MYMYVRESRSISCVVDNQLTTSAVDESVERVVGPDVGLASEAWVLDWVGIKDWAGGGASGESRRHGWGNVAIGYHAAWIVLIGDQSAGVWDLVELWASVINGKWWNMLQKNIFPKSTFSFTTNEL